MQNYILLEEEAAALDGATQMRVARTASDRRRRYLRRASRPIGQLCEREGRGAARRQRNVVAVVVALVAVVGAAAKWRRYFACYLPEQVL